MKCKVREGLSGHLNNAYSSKLNFLFWVCRKKNCFVLSKAEKEKREEEKRVFFYVYQGFWTKGKRKKKEKKIHTTLQPDKNVSKWIKVLCCFLKVIFFQKTFQNHFQCSEMFSNLTLQYKSDKRTWNKAFSLLY